MWVFTLASPLPRMLLFNLFVILVPSLQDLFVVSSSDRTSLTAILRTENFLFPSPNHTFLTSLMISSQLLSDIISSFTEGVHSDAPEFCLFHKLPK